MPRLPLEQMPEEYVEALKAWEDKAKELKDKRYASRFPENGITADDLTELEKEVAELKKQKQKLYAKAYYHKAIKSDNSAIERRREKQRDWVYNKTKKVSLSRDERSKMIQLLAQYEIQGESGDLLILKKKNVE